MGQKHSRDRLMYHYVINGDLYGIQFLGLEWKDKEGKTPLIVAAKSPGLYDVAKSLIELGANVNAYCKANAFVKNRNHQTPLDVARKNGHNVVVREIESRICYFSGHIREFYAPALSDFCIHQYPQAYWVVVVPRSPHNPPRPPKLELVIYSSPRDVEPRKIITLRQSKIKEPRFDHPNPYLTIFDKQTNTRYKFSFVSFDDKHQIRRLFNACKGISQVMPTSAQMMISDAISSPHQSDASTQMSSLAWKTLGSISPPMTPGNNTWVHGSPRHHHQHYSGVNSPVSAQPNIALHTPDKFPSPSPPAVSSPTSSTPPINAATTTTTTVNKVAASVAQTADPTVADEPLDCVVYWESPVEGACVPCGHVSACMSCLKTIKDNDGTCPVCRADIDQVVKLYGI